MREGIVPDASAAVMVGVASAGWDRPKDIAESKTARRSEPFP